MIVAEYKNAGIIVRVHDEHFSAAADQCLSKLGSIVSESYKRRILEQETSVAAMKDTSKTGGSFL